MRKWDKKLGNVFFGRLDINRKHDIVVWCKHLRAQFYYRAQVQWDLSVNPFNLNVPQPSARLKLGVDLATGHWVGWREMWQHSNTTALCPVWLDTVTSRIQWQPLPSFHSRRCPLSKRGGRCQWWDRRWKSQPHRMEDNGSVLFFLLRLLRPVSFVHTATGRGHLLRLMRFVKRDTEETPAGAPFKLGLRLIYQSFSSLSPLIILSQPIHSDIHACLLCPIFFLSLQKQPLPPCPAVLYQTFPCQPNHLFPPC